jgi:hypothetical protein
MLTPNDRLVASVPPIDWKTRSTGAPSRIASIWVVMCASTQLCVGIWKRMRARSTSCSSSTTVRSESETGLMPRTASPEPSTRPSTIAAAMPAAESVGWLGWRRVESRPGRPTVVRKRVTTRILRATSTRSCRRMSFDAAAAISGVRPDARAARLSPVASSDSSQSRSSPTVRWAMGANAAASWVSKMSRVTSSVS